MKFSIFNFQFSINEGNKNTLGYTLLELTIVMTILVVVGIIVVGILVSVLRGNTKTRVTNDVAQNGNYALNIMTDIIINSQAFLSITDTTNTTYQYCAVGVAGGPPLSAITNGKSVTMADFNGGTTTLLCDEINLTIASNSASLLDKSQVLLAPNTCFFSCSQPDVYSPPRLDISFQLKSASGGNVERLGSGTFNTSATVRNQNYR